MARNARGTATAKKRTSLPRMSNSALRPIGPVRTKGVKNGKISGWRGFSVLDAIDCSDADIEVACYRAD